LAAGADVDALVIKDKNGLPYVPGKTIKGLVLESLETLYRSESDKISIEENLGCFDKNANKATQGYAFFSNAELSEEEQKAIVCNKVKDFLYNSLASTSIDDEGIAKRHNLHRMEVTVPCTLYGNIINVSDKFETMLGNSIKLIKRLGQNRNRGLGRCKFSIIQTKEGGNL